MLARTESENRKLSSNATPIWRAQRAQGHVAHVVAVDEHRARAGVVEARHQHGQRSICRCRSARRGPPARPARCAGRSRCSTGGRRSAVAEGGRRSKSISPRSSGELDGVRGVGDGRAQVEELEDPLDPGSGLLADGEDAGQLPGRRDELGDVGREGQERAEGDPVVQGQPAAEGQDGHLADGRGWPRGAAGSGTAAAPPASGSRTASRPRRRPARARGCSWPNALTTRTPLTSSSTIWATSPSRCWPSQVAGNTRQRIR